MNNPYHAVPFDFGEQEQIIIAYCRKKMRSLMYIPSLPRPIHINYYNKKALKCRVYYRARAVKEYTANHVDHPHVTWRTGVRVYGKFKKTELQKR